MTNIVKQQNAEIIAGTEKLKEQGFTVERVGLKTKVYAGKVIYSKSLEPHQFNAFVKHWTRFAKPFELALVRAQANGK